MILAYITHNREKKKRFVLLSIDSHISNILTNKGITCLVHRVVVSFFKYIFLTKNFDLYKFSVTGIKYCNL